MPDCRLTFNISTEMPYRYEVHVDSSAVTPGLSLPDQITQAIHTFLTDNPGASKAATEKAVRAAGLRVSASKIRSALEELVERGVVRVEILESRHALYWTGSDEK